MWRSTCGVIVLAASDGQAAAAVAACLARRRSSASRLSGRPVLVGNSGSSGLAGAFAGQARRTATVCLVSGVMRCLRPLPMAADVRAGAEAHVAAGQADQLGGAQPGLDGEQDQRVVAAADPGRLVGGGEQRVDLGFGEERDERLVEALGRDRQDALDRGGVLGVPQRGVAEQRADRGQPRVAGADRCCRARARGDPGTRRSAAPGDRRCRGRWAPCRCAGRRTPAAAGSCRGRRRSCAGWPGAGRSAGR